MTAFTDTTMCQRRTHCPICRQKANGRQWRRTVGRRYALPQGAPDFTCPFGVAWSETDAASPTQADQRIPDEVPPVCHSCLDRTCPNVTTCCGGRVSVYLVVPCPKGRF
jgi:hypothetical protein